MATKIIRNSASISVFELVKGANNRIVIVAPYIKANSLNRIVPLIPDSVKEFICVTRWAPNDIASGTCDIEIFDIISAIAGGKLLMNQQLHAKFYSNDYSALVGSANLTQRGLGLCIPCNVEILVELSRDIQGIQEWENSILMNSIFVTKDIRDRILTESENITKDKIIQSVIEVEIEENIVSNNWIPQCSSPDRLWTVYTGKNLENLLTNTYEAALEDLKILQVPDGLDEVQFFNHIKYIFSQMEIYYEIDYLSESGLTDESAQQLLMEYIQRNSIEFDPKISWKILKNWLMYFFRDEFRIGGGEQFLYKGREFHKN